MESREVHYLSDKEDEFVGILMGAGVRKPDSRVLVFLVSHPGATARQVALGTDMSASAVSLAVSRLDERGWVTHTKEPGIDAVRHYSLTRELGEIVDEIERGIRENLILEKKKIRGINSWSP